MKILQLRFRNLNSLAGEWSIDFTVPEYVADGIFAISGPTGAGKSTILDAICLALYGRTPRLPVISNSTNEIMSRQTGDCFAEVVFETNEGRFKAHWSQRRAHGNPGGALQQPRHEISVLEGSEGKLLASQIRQTAAVIEEKSGMDFERFIQSMMLAQGGFAAFLKASGNERAPILEQITGTEIYSNISIHVYQQTREHREILERLKSENRGIMLLSDEEEAKIREEMEQEKKKKATLDAKITRIETEMQWLKRIENLRQEIAEINIRKAETEKLNLEFRPSREKLERAIKASYIEGEYASLATLSDQQKNDTEALLTLKQRLPELETEKIKAEKEKFAAEKKFSETKESRDSLLKITKEVRLIDQQISQQEEAGKKITSALESLENERKSIEAARIETEKAVSRLRTELAEIEEYQKQNSEDSSLKGMFASITSLMERLDDSRLNLQDAENRLKSSSELLKNKYDEIENASEKYVSIQKKHNEVIEKLRKIKSETEGLTGGLSYEELLKRKDSLILKIAGLKQIADYDAARAQLVDGSPCPLCGSVHHPYAEGNVPQITEEENELRKLQEIIRKYGEMTKSAEKLSADERKSSDDEAIQKSFLDILRNQYEEIVKKINELADLCNNTKTGYEKIKKDLVSILLPFGITSIPDGPGETERLKTILRTRKSKWEDNESRKSVVNSLIQSKQPEIAVNDNIIKTLDREIAIKKDEYSTLLSLIKKFKLTREELFGTKITDDEERKADEKIAAAEALMNESAGILKRKEEILAEVRTRIRGYEEIIGKREVTIIAARENFRGLLKRNGFQTEEEFMGARMTPDDRALIEKRSKQLEKEKTELEASAKTKNEELERESAKALTIENAGQLADRLERSKAEAALLYEGIIDKTGKLKSNEEAKRRGKEIADRINAQMLVCERWSRLSGLIGSADGKKYRNFAQGLTLEVMVSYANSQLSKLSDRYLLIRNKEEPLDLDVADFYQAGEIRSTKNLSGGESFIVSLALALGLSKMAGRNVRIDSLFLDEGFGTLDEETLETALATLASLRQDGKIIGVISHVGAMKERIGTKITVTPLREGRSIISGPGCRATGGQPKE